MPCTIDIKKSVAKKKQRRRLRQMIEWAWHLLSGPEVDLDVRIVLGTLPQKYTDEGDCVERADHVKIRLSRETLRELREHDPDALNTLFHEVTHAHQIARGDLQYAATDGALVWRGRREPECHFLQECEIEAYGRGATLSEKFQHEILGIE